MKFTEIYSSNNKVFSLEFFPPKKEEKLPSTLNLIKKLSGLNPNFMTVTYGAGGGSRELTKKLTAFIAQDIKTIAVAHLTCANHSVAEIDAILDQYHLSGISNILALRGDPSAETGIFEKHPEGFSCARDLTSHIKQRGDLSIAVAGYPEVHPEAQSADADISYLKEKVDAGAEIILTQLFFDAAYYFSFVERARSIGISVPIVPGIMPISNAKQLKRFTSMCGATIPMEITKALKDIEDNENAVKEFGTEYTIALCKKLFKGGAPGIHLYTLNKSTQAEAIIKALF